MAVFCPGCGRENADGSRFCQSCGAAIPAPPAPSPSAAATMPMPAVTAPPPAAPAYVPPAAYPQAQPSYQQPYQPPYQQPYQPAVYPQVVVKSRSGSGAIVGGVILMIAALVIIVSTFTPWMTSSAGGYGGSASLSGWEMKDIMSNQFFAWGDGNPVFSGICSLIIGGLIAGAALLMLITRSKSLSGLALLFSILAIAIAGTNTYSILAVSEGISLGFGMILFLIFSVVALAGSFISMSG